MSYELEINNPWDNSTSNTGYAFIYDLNLSFIDQVGRIVVGVYANKAAFLAGAKHLYTVGIPLPKEGYPALDADKKELFKKENGKYVLATEKNDPEAVEVTPTYEEIPPFNQFIYSIIVPEGTLPGTPVLGLVAYELYNRLTKRPEFAGAKITEL